ncbi:MAG: hypothetical protein ACFB9N_07715 [Geitlerinemataceae cyanobacterium]
MNASNIQDANYTQMVSFIERNNFTFQEKEENGAKRIDVQSGKNKCCIKVYSTGTIQVQGSNSRLKEILEQAKTAIENEEALDEILPFEIERFPNVLRETIADIDLVIVRFIEEAILSYKAKSLLGCAFLLGSASEKAILLLIETYGNAIDDDKNRTKFQNRIKGKFISKAFDEFKISFKSSKNKPDG